MGPMQRVKFCPGNLSTGPGGTLACPPRCASARFMLSSLTGRIQARRFVTILYYRVSLQDHLLPVKIWRLAIATEPALQHHLPQGMPNSSSMMPLFSIDRNPLSIL